MAPRTRSTTAFRTPSSSSSLVSFYARVWGWHYFADDRGTDHHSGVFLNNEEPAKFHIHTLLRTPNAGDYGFAMRPLIASAKDHFVWDPSIPAEKL